MIVAALLLQAAAPTRLPHYCGPQRVIEDAPRTFSGVWFDGFEDNRFFDGKESASNLPWRDQRVALELRTVPVFRASSSPLAFAKQQYHLYRVTFLGRAWRREPNPTGCMPFPPSPGSSDVGITAESVSRLDDLGEAKFN